MRESEVRYWDMIKPGCMTEESDAEEGERIVTHQLLWRSECEPQGNDWSCGLTSYPGLPPRLYLAAVGEVWVGGLGMRLL